MVAVSIFNSVEFYVITAFIAAAVVAAVAMPSKKSAARTFLYSGILRDDAAPSQAGIVAIVNDSGELVIHRFGLTGIDMETGAFSLAVTITGLDVTIEERITYGNTRAAGSEQATAAYASLDCFGRERYHFQYRSESISASTAFYLNISPGNRIERLLSV